MCYKTFFSFSLFGKEDVDLRQLSMPTHFPAIANNPAGNPFLGKPDEDMRIQPDHRKLSGAFQDNQNPRVVKLIESERRDYMKSPQREDMLTDINSRKSSFNSPQAAKWEKFREKNPEFKEYERQASSSGNESSLFLFFNVDVCSWLKTLCISFPPK